MMLAYIMALLLAFIACFIVFGSFDSSMCAAWFQARTAPSGRVGLYFEACGGDAFGANTPAARDCDRLYAHLGRSYDRYPSRECHFR